MKRIFIALKVEPDEALLMMISSLKSGLKNETIRWINPENIHITLLFLGDTAEERVIKICNMLYEKCTGAGKFELIIRGTGVFRTYNDPRIIWTGIDPSEKLIRLNSIIMKGIRETGSPNEEHPFNPHLTLGRIKNVKDKTALRNWLNKYQNTEFQKVPVNEVILYESILKPAGPLYKPIAKFEL
jgi:2'-5' RNA ligase